MRKSFNVKATSSIESNGFPFHVTNTLRGHFPPSLPDFRPANDLFLVVLYFDHIRVAIYVDRLET